MADNRTMAQMLQAPIEGYEDAIVVPPINANNFELKQTLINLVQSEARTWLDKDPPRSILTWDDLVLKFINQFFPPSKTTYLRNEITTFYQKPNESFNEAWDLFKGLLHALDSAAGGNFLDNMPRDGLAIIESKSKVRYSRSRAIEPRVSTNDPLSTSTPSNSFEFQQLAASLEDKMDIRMSRLEKMISEKNVTTPATVKAVEEVCVTCGVLKTDFENYVKANDAVLKNVQNQGTLPSQTVTNHREHVNAITTRSGKTLEGPSTPIVSEVFTPQKEPERNPETLTEKVQKPSSESTAQAPPPED
ncbi:reverse transcriptase domain-containing protein [Tanacetum coccineum]